MSFDMMKVEGLYPGAGDLMIEPMLIHKSTKEQVDKACSSGGWFGQEKVDGALYMFVKGHCGETYLFGRTKSKKTGLLTEKSANVPHIINALDEVSPNGTVILGEIFYPGKTSKDVVSIMGCLPEKARARQEKDYGLIHYYIYDVLYYDNKNLMGYGNYARAKVAEAFFDKNALFRYNFLKRAEIETENLLMRTNQILEAGGEGMVFKKFSAPYQPGKRPLDNLKVKQVDYIDCVITGFCDPTRDYTGKELASWTYWEEKVDNEGVIEGGDGHWVKRDGLYSELYLQSPTKWRPITKHYYFGWKNAITVGLFNADGETLTNIGTVSSGLTDNLRQLFAEKPESYLGRAVMVQCMSIDKKEKTLRHPFFVDFRSDKDPKDCKMEDVFGE